MAQILLESSVTIRKGKKEVCRDLVNLKSLNLKEFIKMEVCYKVTRGYRILVLQLKLNSVP